MHIANLNGIAIHYRDEGPKAAPALVFVNSLGTDFRIWDGVASHFAADHRVIRYDKRGHGLTDASPAPYSVEDHVGDLEALLDHLSVSDAVFVGLSVGGLIVSGLAAKSPQRVKGLVLCDTAHKIGTIEMWDTRIAMIREGGIACTTDIVMERWFSPSFRRERRAELAIYTNMLEHMPVEGYIGTCMALRDADHTQIYQNLKMPVLLVVGSNDGSTPPDLVRSAHELVKGSRFVVIEGPGHIPCVEAPSQTNDLIEAFLRENRWHG